MEWIIRNTFFNPLGLQVIIPNTTIEMLMWSN